MEDAWFCRDARRRGRMRLLRVPMLTSPRRFYDGGILTVLAFDALIWLWDLLYMGPAVFAPAYKASNARRGSPHVV